MKKITIFLVLLLLISCAKKEASKTMSNISNNRVIELVEALEAEVNNGGFDQFYFNSLGDHVEQTVKALNLIGAIQTAKIVTRTSWEFPDGVPSRDRITRQIQLEKISPDSELFEAADDEFMEYKEDISELLQEYIKGNR